MVVQAGLDNYGKRRLAIVTGSQSRLSDFRNILAIMLTLPELLLVSFTRVKNTRA